MTLLSNIGVCLNSFRENSIYKSQAAETSAFVVLRLAASSVSIEMNIHLLKNGGGCFKESSPIWKAIYSSGRVKGQNQQHTEDTA